MFDKLKNYKNIKILNNLEFKDGKFTESKSQQLPSSNAGPDFFEKKMMWIMGKIGSPPLKIIPLFKSI